METQRFACSFREVCCVSSSTVKSVSRNLFTAGMSIKMLLVFLAVAIRINMENKGLSKEKTTLLSDVTAMPPHFDSGVSWMFKVVSVLWLRCRPNMAAALWVKAWGLWYLWTK